MPRGAARDCDLEEDSLRFVPQILVRDGGTIAMRRHFAMGLNEGIGRRDRRRRSSGSPLSASLLSIAVLASLAMMAAACSSSNTPTTTTTAVIPTTPAVIPTTPAPASSTSGTDLSGTWSGHYSGAFSGTFTLTWQQSSSKLSGTIDLSSDGSPQINGTVTGDTIKFGTVGSTAITYSGTVSGDSMTGTYTVGGSTGGSWSANKT